MTSCILIGKPNVGKTSFFLSFAGYLGITKCLLTFKSPDGEIKRQAYQLELAQKYLISQSPFKTKEICEIELQLPVYKGTKELKLLDTGGVIDGIHEDEYIRKSMALTLESIQGAKAVLHLLDAPLVAQRQELGLTQIDDQINRYGILRGRYCILANKMDLPLAQEGLRIIQNRYPNTYIIPLSNVNSLGFREVKQFVGRNI